LRPLHTPPVSSLQILSSPPGANEAKTFGCMRAEKQAVTSLVNRVMQTESG